MAGNPILFSDPQGLNETNSKGTWSTGDDGIPIFTPNPGFEVVVTANRTPESVIANDNSFYDFLNKNKIKPSVNNWSISEPKQNWYSQTINIWNNYNKDTPEYPEDFFPWLVSNTVYSSIDALQITTTNIFAKLHISSQPARDLQNRIVNQNEIQDAFGNVYANALFWGIGRTLSALKPTANLADDAVNVVDDVAVAAADEVAEGVGNGGTKLLGNARDNLLSAVENPKLRNIVDQLYRPGAKVGRGSSMDAYRLEQLTGGTVGGKSHAKKIIDYRKALQRMWSDRANLSSGDRQITKQLLEDIQNALSGH